MWGEAFYQVRNTKSSVFLGVVSFILATVLPVVIAIIAGPDDVSSAFIVSNHRPFLFRQTAAWMDRMKQQDQQHECWTGPGPETTQVAPWIHIPLVPSLDVSKSLVAALQTSGFLRVTTPLVPVELQQKALRAATTILLQQDESDETTDPPVTVTHHPTDPKIYAMLTSPPSSKCQGSSSSPSAVLADYWEALELAKRAILRCIAVGLDLDPSYLERLHDENNSSLRLLRYPKGTTHTGNRCKEHSDYGTITLLLTDGLVSGLEAFHEGTWIPVPHDEPAGALVVNAGSLLETWTNQAIPATLHRVAGPASMGSTSSPESLLDAVKRDRTSIAFFADPNQDAKASLLLQQQGANKETTEKQIMNVADYIRWRSGGDHKDGKRSGLAFTQEEEDRIQRSTDG
eukprot:scaffold59010_cov44-Attheya_sp.AAC.1